MIKADNERLIEDLVYTQDAVDSKNLECCQLAGELKCASNRLEELRRAASDAVEAVKAALGVSE